MHRSRPGRKGLFFFFGSAGYVQVPVPGKGGQQNVAISCVFASV